MAEDRDKWRAYGNMVMKLPLHNMQEIYSPAGSLLVSYEGLCSNPLVIIMAAYLDLSGQKVSLKYFGRLPRSYSGCRVLKSTQRILECYTSL